MISKGKKVPPKNIASFGTWVSPITPKTITNGVVELKEIVLDGNDIYWLEGRPDENGRFVIVKRGSDGFTKDITPKGFNVRNAVHEYGGGAYAVKNEVIFFSNWSDQRVYRQEIGSDPLPITPISRIQRGDRYSDLEISPDGRFIVCVRERHFQDQETDNELVVIPTGTVFEPKEPKVIAQGYDFFSSPKISPFGDAIAWIAWNHPNMPWDDTELWSGTWAVDGSVEFSSKILGGSTESFLQPQWSPSGSLFFISDKSNWWNVYSWRDGAPVKTHTESSDFTSASWAFGVSNYTFLSNSKIAIGKSGQSEGAFILLNKTLSESKCLKLKYSDISYVKGNGDLICFVGAGPCISPEVVILNIETADIIVLRKSCPAKIDPDFISEPFEISFDSTENGQAYGFYYAPKNELFYAPENEKPPLLVKTHGGPTGSATTTLDLSIQFWTSRGFAVVDVNYRGSTGYGREFRNLLRGKWGIYDSDDCISAAKYLTEKGLADEKRLIIRGSSAGGYTTINALTFHNLFAAGAAYYGIADLNVFLGETHKFESRYLDSLVGPYPEFNELYFQRSAINFANKLNSPMIIFQGLEDKIVPPSQAEIMVNALNQNGIMHAYIPFEGEQHGFRIAKNIEYALEVELSFYGKVLGFTPAGIFPDFEIKHDVT